jgi:PAS domain S-box-containing protein
MNGTGNHRQPFRVTSRDPQTWFFIVLLALVSGLVYILVRGLTGGAVTGQVYVLAVAGAALCLVLVLVILWYRLRREGIRYRAMMRRRRASEENFRELFQNASDAIWIHDIDGDITDVNRADEELVGYSRDQLIGMNAREFLGDDARHLAARVRDKLMRGEPVEPRYVQRLIRGDGSEATIEITTRLIKRDGQPVAFQNIARDVTREHKLRRSLHFSLQKVLAAQEDERKRIARELHDDTAQALLFLIHSLDALHDQTTTLGPEEIARQLRRLHEVGVKTLTDLRRYTQKLRPAILDDLGLMAALEWLADGIQAETQIEVDVRWDGPRPELSRDAQLALFRIAQEALNNVRKHAGADRVTVRLSVVKGQLVMSVTDNGHGFEPPEQTSELSVSGKLGLLGMRERAELLGGELEIISSTGGGTEVRALVPLEELPASG